MRQVPLAAPIDLRLGTANNPDMTPQELLDHFGSLTEAARALNVKPPSVSEWVSSGVVPLGRQCQAEIITEGKLRADREALAPAAGNGGVHV